MNVLIVTTETQGQADIIHEVLATAEEEGVIDFAFSVRRPNDAEGECG